MAYRKLDKPRTREETLAIKREHYRRTYTSRAKPHPLKEGDRFSRLTVTVAYYDHGKPAVQCVCDCGATVYPLVTRLVHGRAKSCGCLLRDIQRNTGNIRFGGFHLDGLK